MLRVAVTVGVEVDPETVLVVGGGDKVSSFWSIAGKRAQVHSRAERWVLMVEAIVISSGCSTSIDWADVGIELGVTDGIPG